MTRQMWELRTGLILSLGDDAVVISMRSNHGPEQLRVVCVEGDPGGDETGKRGVSLLADACAD